MDDTDHSRDEQDDAAYKIDPDKLAAIEASRLPVINPRPRGDRRLVQYGDVTVRIPGPIYQGYELIDDDADPYDPQGRRRLSNPFLSMDRDELRRLRERSGGTSDPDSD